MGSKILRRSSGFGFTLITGLGSLALLVAMAMPAAAVTEEDIGASASAPAASEPAAAEPPSQPESTIPAGRDVSPNLSASNVRSHPTFPYTIRPGDTLGTIAATFGISVADIAHANRMSPDSELTAGDILRIPNPFVARERSLIEEIEETSSARQAAEQRAATSEQKVASLRAQVEELQGAREQSERPARIAVVARVGDERDCWRVPDAWRDDFGSGRMVDVAKPLSSGRPDE